MADLEITRGQFLSTKMEGWPTRRLFRGTAPQAGAPPIPCENCLPDTTPQAISLYFIGISLCPEVVITEGKINGRHFCPYIEMDPCQYARWNVAMMTYYDEGPFPVDVGLWFYDSQVYIDARVRYGFDFYFFRVHVFQDAPHDCLKEHHALDNALTQDMCAQFGIVGYEGTVSAIPRM